MLLPSLAALILLACVHLFAHRLRFMDGVPRSRWLSAAGGISLAYVFLHLLPELAEGQELLGEAGLGLRAVEFEIYGLALAGLVGFYGLERMAQLHERVGRDEGPGGARVESHPGFWLHLGMFALYNVITGYLLLHRGGHREHEAEAAGPALAMEPGMAGLLTFALAMALHFCVTDYGLREDYREGWLRTGRWTLVAAVVAGWVLGLVVQLPELAVLGAIALLGGGVILNVLKEELPEERQSRFGALVLGVVAYAALLALT